MEQINQNWILIPQNVQKTILKGILIVKDQEFRIAIELNSKSDIKGASFNCEWELKSLLASYEEVIQQRLQQSQSLDEFLSEVHSITYKLLNVKDRRSGRQDHNLSIDHYSKVIKEIEKVGWGKLLHLDPDFNSITLSAIDAASREHNLNLKFISEHSQWKVICQADLPAPFNPVASNQHDGVICHVYQQFIQELEKHQDLWDILGEFDANCWVLEPEAKSWSCCYRRIALGNKASLLVTINPYQPRYLPTCRFLGPDQVVSPLRERWNSGLTMWNHERTVLSNIKEILEIDLPSSADFHKEDYSMDCSICYAYRLIDEIPEVSCDDSRCGQLFHSTCLIEWIRSLPNFRQSFNILFGECPYCSTPLTVKMCKQSRPAKKIR